MDNYKELKEVLNDIFELNKADLDFGIYRIINQKRNPEIDKFIEKNLAITEKIRMAMVDKGWSLKHWDTVMNTPPSVVSKWLSGMHNLSL